jgi:hypothetical protein
LSGNTDIYGTLRQFSPHSPLSQHNFKWLVENPERTEIFTYPYGITPDTEEENTSYHHSTAIANMNPDLIKIIVIALLAARPNEIEQPKRCRFYSRLIHLTEVFRLVTLNNLSKSFVVFSKADIF